MGCAAGNKKNCGRRTYWWVMGVAWGQSGRDLSGTTERRVVRKEVLLGVLLRTFALDESLRVAASDGHLPCNCAVAFKQLS